MCSLTIDYRMCSLSVCTWEGWGHEREFVCVCGFGEEGGGGGGGGTKRAVWEGDDHLEYRLDERLDLAADLDGDLADGPRGVVADRDVLRRERGGEEARGGRQRREGRGRGERGGGGRGGGEGGGGGGGGGGKGGREETAAYSAPMRVCWHG